MTTQTRTRFAPSPTGYLHIGGARTALYNYLLAKKHHGVFILRIEDTDSERSTPEAIEAILQGMSWLGLKHDEGPFYQTKRYDLYNQHIDKLVAADKAYPCFCTSDDLQKKRTLAQATKVKYRYDRTCWNLSSEERLQKIKSGIPYCIRFFSTDEGTVVVDDLIKGRVEISAMEMDDLIIRRTDGHPTYNFCVVVDDALMGVSQVIRGDDHFNNAFRQVQMYEALGYSVPQFAHCSMINGPDGKKLSKRHGATSVMAYREMGYLPQALLNYLVRLGWSHKDQEIFSMAEMIELFDINSVSSSCAIFDMQKLDWLNGHYIRESNARELVPLIKEFLVAKGVTEINEAVLLRCVQVSQAKVKTLKEMADFVDLFFMDVPVEEEVVAKVLDESARKNLKLVRDRLLTQTDFTHDALKVTFDELVAQTGLKMGLLANPVRVALSGRKISPGVFDLLEIFGKERSLEKLKRYFLS